LADTGYTVSGNKVICSNEGTYIMIYCYDDNDYNWRKQIWDYASCHIDSCFWVVLIEQSNH